MAAQDAIPFPVYVVHADTLKLLAVNTAMRKRSGSVVGGLCYKEIYGQDVPCMHCPLVEMMAKKDMSRRKMVFELFNEADDRWYQMEETLIPWHDGTVAKYSIAVDVTALKETQNALVEAHAELALTSRQLERLAITDQLTGLSNRRRLDDTLTSEVQRAERYGTTLSAIICDVDRFKDINDLHGHQVGDAVLTEMAQVLKDNVRHLDTVGRWGGEEFAIICPETAEDGALTLAEKLRGTIAGHDLSVAGRKTMSFGVATFRPGETVTDLIRRADKALYRAKEKGRNRVET
ncbi:GGDEF domain-containing protein [Roseospira visakhapatnamensis]|uniref:diguanylate cyclase n=1 Tax=Roseospira visakhapatnamensis TaxID=390880 RepID=A0A7W6RED3_9PROT|nr:GGDEF domain-containing protein [Roseospira visakhapatnamensis]MBB4266772.1 diguanylate cyclase (GGDEF)-like protein [Roseospira visakhapatnamensis]